MEPEGDAVVPQQGSRPSFGRGLSRQYSLYPSKPSLKSWRGVLTVAIDTVKFLYTNDFTRGIGRDILFYGGSIIVIRLLVSALQEDLNIPT